MTPGGWLPGVLIGVLFTVCLLAARWRQARRRRSPGPGVPGAVWRDAPRRRERGNRR